MFIQLLYTNAYSSSFTVIKNWNNPNAINQVQGTEVVGHAYDGIILSNKKGLLIHTETWVDLKDYTLKEISAKHYILRYFTYNILRNKTSMIKNRSETFRE